MKTLGRILFVCLAMTLSVSADTKKVEVTEAEKLMKGKIQVLDVRTKKEWDEGRLEGAVRVDFLEKDFAKKVAKAIDPKKPVLVYCRSSGRSGQASKVMETLGFSEIRDLDGGIIAWRKAGGKVVK